jgi:hypothetical protein
MKKSGESKPMFDDTSKEDQVAAYSQIQAPVLQTVCEALRELIASALPKASSKIWHGSPVWFIDANPVVGYSANAEAVKLLFWNGQAFAEPALKPVGKYRAAQAVFNNAAEVDPKLVRRWLKKARADVFDSKAFFKQLRAGK